MSKPSFFLIVICLASLCFASCQKQDGPTGIGPNTPNLPFDYIVQSIPDIGTYMPRDLLLAMQDHLHFGDNPPRIDTCFHTDSIRLDRYIKADPSTPFYLIPQTFAYPFFSWGFNGQHQCVIDRFRHDEPIVNDDSYQIFATSNGTDSIFIIGEDPYFTVYYKINHTLKTWASNIGMATYLAPLNGRELKESIIICGTAINQNYIYYLFTKKDGGTIRTETYSKDSSSYIVGDIQIPIHEVRYLDTLQSTQVIGIKDLHIGARIENSVAVESMDFYAIHDILLFSYPHPVTIDTTFYNGSATGN